MGMLTLKSPSILLGILVAVVLGSSVFFSFAALQPEDFDVHLQVPFASSRSSDATIRTCEITAKDADGNPTALKCQGISKLIVMIYEWLVGAAGVLATAMIAWGGFQWLSAAGDSKRVEEGKKVIHNALVGLVLALGSYTLLALINPDLVKPGKLDLAVIKKGKDVLLTGGGEDSGQTVGGGGGTNISGFQRLAFWSGPKNDLANTGSGATTPGGDFINPKVTLLLHLIDNQNFGFPVTITSMRSQRLPPKGKGSHHTDGRGFDISTDTANLQKLVEVAKFLKSSPYVVNIDEMFFSDDLGQTPILDRGTPVSFDDYKKFDSGSTYTDHKDHLHVAVKK